MGTLRQPTDWPARFLWSASECTCRLARNGGEHRVASVGHLGDRNILERSRAATGEVGIDSVSRRRQQQQYDSRRNPGTKFVLPRCGDHSRTSGGVLTRENSSGIDLSRTDATEDRWRAGRSGLRGLASGFRVSLQPFQVSAQIAGRVVAQVAVFFQSLPNNFIQSWRQRGIQLQRRYRVEFKNRVKNYRRSCAGKRQAPRCHLIDHDA